MTRLIHFCLCIEGALRQKNLTWLNDDNGNPLSTIRAKRLLIEELAKGKKYLVSDNCNNVDADGRCLGHDVEEAIA